MSEALTTTSAVSILSRRIRRSADHPPLTFSTQRSVAKESDATQLLKIREGDIAHGLPVNPELNRIRFDEAAEDLKIEYAVNGRRSSDELPHFEGRRLVAITTTDVNAFTLKRQREVMVVGDGDDRHERTYSNGEINRELTTLKHILNLARAERQVDARAARSDA